MTDKDGLAKNLEKFEEDWEAICVGWAEEQAQQDGWTHQYVQRFVTAARRGPYLVGHADSIVWPVCLLSMLANVALAVVIWGMCNG